MLILSAFCAKNCFKFKLTLLFLYAGKNATAQNGSQELRFELRFELAHGLNQNFFSRFGGGRVQDDAWKGDHEKKMRYQISKVMFRKLN